MDRRLPLVGAAAALVAGGIVLAFKIRAMSSEPSRPSRDDTPDPISTPGGERPGLSESTSSSSSDSARPATETEVDGVKIRDHRSGERGPYQPRSPAADGPREHKDRLPPQLVRDITAKLQAAMTECTEAIPDDARGPRPGIRGSVLVDIVSHTLSVKESSPELVDVTGDAATVAKRCLQEKWGGVSTPSGDTPETANYPITIVFSLPSR